MGGNIVQIRIQRRIPAQNFARLKNTKFYLEEHAITTSNFTNVLLVRQIN